MNQSLNRPMKSTAGIVFALIAASCLMITAPVKAQTPANQYNYSRTDSFTYNLSNGLLMTETAEPTNPQLCVQSSYAYDGYGNLTTASAANCSGATGTALFTTRQSSKSFASQSATVDGVSVTSPAGTFTSTSTNALSQSESKIYDPRFGVPVSLTDVNGLVTTWQLDDWGRVIQQTRPDGNSTVTYYCFISGKVGNISSNSSNCPSPASNEIPALAVTFVHSEPHNPSGVKNGPFSRVYMDAAGRKIRSVTEAFDGPNE